jgi:hypothetical protein
MRAIYGRTIRTTLLALTAFVVTLSSGVAYAQAAAKPEDQPYVIDYYYKAKWGYAGEFLRLFKKNHYPVLKKEIESGRILSVTVVAPRYHGTEEGRWDYRVTITFKNAVAANTPDPNSADTLKQLYPDQATFEKEEQRRFEILEAHWDVPIVKTDVDK